MTSRVFRQRVSDLLTGKDVWGNYLFLEESQWWPAERIEDLRREKLGKILLHCYENVPAYKKIFQEASLYPPFIDAYATLKALPVIDKDYLIEHINSFTPSNLKSIKGVKNSKTSGTTGQVLYYRNDASSRGIVWGSFMRFKEWMGYDRAKRFILFRGRNFVREAPIARLKTMVSDYLTDTVTLDSYSLSEKDISKLIKLLDKHPDSIIRGYVLNIVDIASILKKMGRNITIRAVSTTAEPLLDFHRDLITSVFNCRVFDQYGCGEIGGVAYECDHHKGLHITEEHVIFETGINGEIILTDLDNYSFPFLRYRNGDMAVMTDKQCSCGRTGRLIKSVAGRTSDNLHTTSGLPVHWGYFHHLLIYTGIGPERNMIKFQVVQEHNLNILLKIQSDPLKSADKILLKAKIREKFGNIGVEIINVDTIPSGESGKFKAVISKLAR